MMENRENPWKKAQQQRMKKYRKLLIMAGIPVAISVIAGLIWGQFLIPLGCLFAAVGILLLTDKTSYDSDAVNYGLKAAYVVMIIFGGVLLFNGLAAGLGRQDDQSYAQSLGVSAEEVLATTDSEGTQYAVIRDGALSRRLLPAEYQAERAEDIGAVLIVNTVHEKTGSYTNGGTAYRTNVRITLKSLKTGEVLSSTVLYGSEPPSHVRISPLDPNKDRYGAAPSDESIRSTCVTMITQAQAEEARRSRVTLLSEEALLALVRQKVADTAGEDGWSSVNAVESALVNADPDFSIQDYGFGTLMQYFKSDARFAVKERDLRDFVNYMTSSDYVRWAD